MTRRDPRHHRSGGSAPASGRFLRWFPVVLVLAVLVAAAASYRFDLGARWFGFEGPDPSVDPAAVAPPPGLTLPPLVTPDPVAQPVTAVTGTGAGPLAPGRVERALARALRDDDLGPDVFASVAGLTGPELFSRGDGSAVPASTLKLLTGVAALETLGPAHVFSTDVVPDGNRRIVLVGGGDPFLAGRRVDGSVYPARANVVSLAKATAAALGERGVSRVRVGYDDSLFSGPAFSPHWPASYRADGVVTPISALWVDEGRPAVGARPVDDPAAVAAAAFAGALARQGVEVVGVARPRSADPEAAPLASVTSAPLSQIVERVLSVSDNEGAEVLARHVGLATTGVGSFAAGARGVLTVLRDLDVPVAGAKVRDGSGLSRKNLLDPDTLIGVLQAAASPERPELRSVLTGLPVAGFTGSLEFRFDDAPRPGRGHVRAKTGTLSGVSALAGIATDLDGRPIVFVLMADRVALVDTLGARDALDDLAAALGSCRCGR